MTHPHIVIIGGGHAAAQAITSLRMKKYDGKVTLVSDELHLPYQRPPLSKAYLKGDLPTSRLPIIKQTAYDSLSVDLKLGCRVSSIDPENKTISVTSKESAEAIQFDKLIIATGGRARRLNCIGGDLPAIHQIRTLDDIDSLKPSFHDANTIAIIGGGYIGLEAASVAAEAGKKAIIIEATERLLSRVVAPDVSAFYHALHNHKGVEIHTNSLVTKIEQRTNGLIINTETGQKINADMIICGIGMIANSELAAQAGLTCDQLGITINAHCQTSDPDIYAVGDVTSFYHPLYQRQMRLESVPNAADQAKTAIDHIVGGDSIYDSLPWFWSDQYGLKLQIAGLSDGATMVITRGDTCNLDAPSVSFIYIKDNRVIAADTIGRLPDFMATKKLIASQKTLDDSQIEQIKNDQRSLKEIIADWSL